jgi:hypothetical protein
MCSAAVEFLYVIQFLISSRVFFHNFFYYSYKISPTLYCDINKERNCVSGEELVLCLLHINISTQKLLQKFPRYFDNS